MHISCLPNSKVVTLQSKVFQVVTLKFMPTRSKQPSIFTIAPLIIPQICLITIVSSLLILRCTDSLGECLSSTEATIHELRRDLRHRFDASGPEKPLIATTVRLTFHDCGGPHEPGDDGHGPSICNGCVNLDNPDNYGLHVAVEAMEEVYRYYDHAMSRADFYVAAGT